MKKILSILLGLGISLLYFSCDKNNNYSSTLNEELLIEHIVNSSVVEAVNVQNLPYSISDHVHMNHSLLEIEMVFHASRDGYEVFLENGLCIFFDENGNHLDHDGLHGDEGNHHGGGDHDINFCLAGDTLDVNVLPPTVLDYITTNYIGANILTVVLKPSGNLAVEINTGEILMFGPTGNYYHECSMQATGGHGHTHGNIGGPGWHCNPDVNMGGGHHGNQGHGNHGNQGHGNHGGMDNHSGSNQPCWGGTSLSIRDLPTVIIEYLESNFPDAEIEHTMQAFNNNYFLRLSNCVRLVFEKDGNIIFSSED